MEYLVTMTTRVPDRTPDEAVQDIRTREAAHSRDLAARGHLLRLWRPPLQPGEWRTLGLFAALDGDRLEEVLASMPLRVWRTRLAKWQRGGHMLHKASVGDMRAARRAGSRPARAPMAMAAPAPPTHASVGMTVAQPLAWA